MKRNEIDFLQGNVTFWDLDNFNPRIAVIHQIDDLKEDLLQVEYPLRKVVDVGWYPSFNTEGEFAVCIIENSDWEFPVFESRTSDPRKMLEELKKAIEIANPQ